MSYMSYEATKGTVPRQSTTDHSLVQWVVALDFRLNKSDVGTRVIFINNCSGEQCIRLIFVICNRPFLIGTVDSFLSGSQSFLTGV